MASSEILRVYQMLDPKPAELVVPGRKFIREGPVLIFNPKQKRKKQRYFFLFNDVLLLTKKEGERKYWLKIYISLKSGLKVVDVLDSQNEPPDVEFRIYSPKKAIICFGHSRKGKEEWLAAINGCIHELELQEKNAANRISPDTLRNYENDDVSAEQRYINQRQVFEIQRQQFEVQKLQFEQEKANFYATQTGGVVQQYEADAFLQNSHDPFNVNSSPSQSSNHAFPPPPPDETYKS